MSDRLKESLKESCKVLDALSPEKKEALENDAKFREARREYDRQAS